MPRPFYEFTDRSFNEELLEHFVGPAAHWLMGGEAQPELLPAFSGSNWECALSMEFLLRILDAGQPLPGFDVAQAEAKCVATTKWLIDRIQYHDPQRASWDGVTWDTAVCLRAVLHASRTLDPKRFADADRSAIEELVLAASLWLIETGQRWDTDVRYSAGPPDLAQSLNTLILVERGAPRVVDLLRDGYGISFDEVLDEMARLVIAMMEVAETTAVDGNFRTCFWVDAFNTAEVLEGLSAYVGYCEARATGRPGHFRQCREAVIEAIRYLETSQVDGTWGGVADTCGTLLGYLRVVAQTDRVGFEDHVVFKALRWMCDEKQALDDGSFLHTTYVTVFYALAIWEAYSVWPLGHRTTPEVYDIALWNAPVQSTQERSHRLELQIRLEDTEAALGRLAQRRKNTIASLIAAATAGAMVVVGLLVMVASRAVRIDLRALDFDILDPDLFYLEASLVVAVAWALGQGAFAVASRD